MSASTSHIPNTEHASLDRCPEDIHHLVLSEIGRNSPSAIFALSQTCRALRLVASPLVYQNLVLKKGSSEDAPHRGYKALFDIFDNDQNCEVARHVRSIVVKDDIPEAALKTILNKVSECSTLRKLSWETPAHMPSSILHKIHATWPDLELSVKIPDRLSAVGTHRQMDTNLLSSPLLKNLVYTIFTSGYPGHFTPSEWPKLTKALVSGGNIQKLCIRFRTDAWHAEGGRIVSSSEPNDLMRLNLKPETPLPFLTEFSLTNQRWTGSSSYRWNEEHCRMLRDALDWSKMRKLSFGEDHPDEFFSVFTGRLPNLKVLQFGLLHDSFDGAMESRDAARDFIGSLIGLESLDIAQADYGLDHLWPAIMKHKDTLKELILRPSKGNYFETYRPIFINKRYLATFSEEFSQLKRLGWIVRCEQNINADYLAILSTMNLEKLDLFFQLPGAASDFSDKLARDAMGSVPDPPLNIDATRNAAIAIMEMISQAQQQPLKWLTFYISRTGEHQRFQPFLMYAQMQMRRNKDEDVDASGKYEIRGNQKWQVSMSLKDILALEEE